MPASRAQGQGPRTQSSLFSVRARPSSDLNPSPHQQHLSPPGRFRKSTNISFSFTRQVLECSLCFRHWGIYISGKNSPGNQASWNFHFKGVCGAVGGHTDWRGWDGSQETKQEAAGNNLDERGRCSEIGVAIVRTHPFISSFSRSMPTVYRSCSGHWGDKQIKTPTW